MKLQEKYKKEIAPKMMETFKYDNVMEIPSVKKVVLNVGFGRHNKEKEYIDNVVSGLTRISGQKPVLTKAKKAISAFKIREGMIIGSSVTLRGEKMYDFLDKLINISFARIRDFRGISDHCIDRTGNMTVGFKEHLAFPEIRADEVDKIFGLEISIHTTAKNREEGLELFKLMGLPFKKQS
jgi:large subunit ribosomal protein L5